MLNLLDLLTVDNIYRLEVLKFTHSWHNGRLPEEFDNTFQYDRNIHRYNTRYTAKQNFYKYKAKTNAGKQSVSYMTIDIWKDLSSSLKNLSACVCISKVYKTLPSVRTKTELIFHLAKFVN